MRPRSIAAFPRGFCGRELGGCAGGEGIVGGFKAHLRAWCAILEQAGTQSIIGHGTCLTLPLHATSFVIVGMRITEMRLESALVLAFAATSLAGCGKPAPSVRAAFSGGAPDCASQATAVQLKTMVFAKAADDARPQDRLIIPNLAAQTKMAIEIPVLDSVDHETRKVRCSARLTFTFPSTAAPLFGGVSASRQDVAYSIQPTADGSGPLYTLEGAEPFIAGLANTDLSAWATSTGDSVAVNSPVQQPSAASPAAQAGGLAVRSAFDPEGEIRRDPALSALSTENQRMFANAHDRDAAGQVAAEQAQSGLRVAACPDRQCVEAELKRNRAQLSQWQQ